MNIYHWFLPHRDTHKKAHLISWEGMTIYILLFILLQVSFSIIDFAKPGILGTSSNITQVKIIELTNIERAKAGLPPVVENNALDQAAEGKAQNMFAENYWAHFAPSGKTPWDFILAVGYKFTFAGENLAKSFYNPGDVVAAWMASPSHKENLLNPKYRDIGIAVEDGVLNGQKTTLVVQMFGTTAPVTSAPVVKVSDKNLPIPKDQYQKPALVAAAVQRAYSAKPMIDPYSITKTFSVSVIILLAALLIVDFVVLKRRGVFRISSHHFGHMAFLSASMILILLSKPGSII